MPAQVADDYVYLDYAATAPLCEEAVVAMAPYLVAGRANLQVGGNANSLHSVGQAAFERMEEARKVLARCIGARRPDEVFFTAGATEADNEAIFGLAQGAVEERRKRGRAPERPHIIVTRIEHSAVQAPAKRLEAQGFRLTRLNPGRQGFIDPETLRNAIDADTVLVSVQMANSEVGSIQPVEELARIAHEAGALFHTDATQALGKIPVDVAALGVDAASFAAHKIGGPKGVGALYLKARTPFSPMMVGGGQESGKRSGTQNVCGMAAFAASCEAACGMLDAERERLTALRDELYARLSAIEGVAPTVEVEAGGTRHLPNIVHVLVDGFESETLILRLDARGIGVSGGSACSSHSLEPSSVLTAMGIQRSKALGALRVSFGRYTTHEDIERFIEAFKDSLK